MARASSKAIQFRGQSLSLHAVLVAMGLSASKPEFPEGAHLDMRGESYPYVDSEGLVQAYQQDGRWVNWWARYKPSSYQFLTRVIFERDESGVPASVSELDSALPIVKPYWMGSDGNGGDDVSCFGRDGGIRATWLGHATVLAEIDGLSVITDPVFSDRISASQYFGPKRYRAAACTVADLPEGLDAVLLSHDHYDHLDINSVAQLHARYGNSLHWFAPLGIGEWLMTNLGVRDVNVHELTWWQEARHPRRPDVKLFLTPANHWCRRGLFDVNRNLWGSWAVVGPHHRFWFAGDTAYAAEAFRQIGQKLGPFDLSVIPIGAYNPRRFMQWVHVNPEEAVMIHRDLRSRKSVGVHWGTVKLTFENWLEPRDRLRGAVKDSELGRDEFVAVAIGETVEGAAA